MTIFAVTGIVIICLVLGYFIVEYSFLVPSPKGIPILMYHKVSADKTSRDTITASMLEQQFEFIVQKGYHAVSFRELRKSMETGQPLPARPVVLTFDDAYVNFSEHAFPLLKKYNLKATVFIPVAYMGKTNVWDLGDDPVLSSDQVKELSRDEHVEFGIHSFLHRSYSEFDVPDMKDDLVNCFNTLDYFSIPYERVLAFPFGAYPKKDPELKVKMKSVFREMKLHFALRIGNRINRFPFPDPYEITRTEIRGTDSLMTFRIKLKKGRKKLFS